MPFLDAVTAHEASPMASVLSCPSSNCYGTEVNTESQVDWTSDNMAQVHSQLLWRSQQYVHSESDFLGPCLGKSGQPLLCTPRPPRSGFGAIQESAVPLGGLQHTQANTLFSLYNVNQRLTVEVVLNDDERRTSERVEDRVCEAVYRQRGIRLRFVSRIDAAITAETSATQFAQSTVRVWPTRNEPSSSSDSFQESPTECGSDIESHLTRSSDLRPATRPRRAETRNQQLPTELITKILSPTCLCWSAEKIDHWPRSATERRFVPVDAAFAPGGLFLAFEHHCNDRGHRKVLSDFTSQERRMGRSITRPAKTLWYVSFDPRFGFEGMQSRDGSLATPRRPSCEVNDGVSLHTSFLLQQQVSGDRCVDPPKSSVALTDNNGKRRREAELSGDAERDIDPEAHEQPRDSKTRRTRRENTPEPLRHGGGSSAGAVLSVPATPQEPLIWKEDAMYLQLRKGWWLR
jgi:hypothetical protein